MFNLFVAMAVISQNTFASAPEALVSIEDSALDNSALDELNPFDPNIENILSEIDAKYETQTGIPAFIDEATSFIAGEGSCSRSECAVWISIDKDSQRATLTVNGVQQAVWKVSTGTAGHGTPDFDRHPNGRIYDSYTSTKFPGGDYNGLGNMPYAVFISGGFAVHGTGQNNWPRLGTRASHGCIRLHPDNAKIFNRLVRKNGIMNTWITVE
jgi:lipoprotein-anchoring transpeptidase ErfK/SrfK